MTFWHAFNRRVYRAYYRLRHRRGATPTLAEAERKHRVLYIAWGRIGDTVLSTGILKHFRAAFSGCRLVCAGRPEIQPVVEPYFDEFVPLDQLARSRGPYECVLGDIHLFYGGTHKLGGLLEALLALRKFVYEGYHLGDGLAPVRVYPRDAEVIPALDKSSADLDGRHVLLDNEYYFGAVMRRLYGEPCRGAEDCRPVLAAEPDADLLRRFELERDEYVIWQPRSNNRKKDFPRKRWRQVLQAFPKERFVALGTAREQGAVVAPNVSDLCGKTTLPQAVQLIAGARAFVGLDSGLTHVAACLGKPTVCVAQNSNLGYFFPYPAAYGFDNLRTVYHPDFVECAGCFMTCSRESIFSTYLRGAKCLRELPVDSVIEAMQATLASARTSGFLACESR